MPFCAQCGRETRTDDVFCNNCGNPLGPALIPASPGTPPPPARNVLPPWLQAWVPRAGLSLLFAAVAALLCIALLYFIQLIILDAFRQQHLEAFHDIEQAVDSGALLWRITLLALYVVHHIPLTLSASLSAENNVLYMAGSAWLPITCCSLLPAVLLYSSGRLLASSVHPHTLRQVLQYSGLLGGSYAVVMLIIALGSSLDTANLLALFHLNDAFDIEGFMSALATAQFRLGPSAGWTLVISFFWGALCGGAGLYRGWLVRERSAGRQPDGLIPIWLHAVGVSGRTIAYNMLLGFLIVVILVLSLSSRQQSGAGAANGDLLPLAGLLTLWAPSLGMLASGLCHLSSWQALGSVTGDQSGSAQISLSLWNGFVGSGTLLPRLHEALPAWVWLGILIPIALGIIGGAMLCLREVRGGREPRIPLIALHYALGYTAWLLVLAFVTSGAGILRMKMSGDLFGFISMPMTSTDGHAGLTFLSLLVLGGIIAYAGGFLGAGWRLGWDVRRIVSQSLPTEQVPVLTRFVRLSVASVCVILILFLFRQIALELPVAAQVLVPNYQLTVGRLIGVISGFIIALLLANLAFDMETVLVRAGIWTPAEGLQRRLFVLGAAWLVALYAFLPLLPMLFQKLEWLYFALFGVLFLILLLRYTSTMTALLLPDIPGVPPVAGGAMPPLPNTRICPNCSQHGLPADARFCARCGWAFSSRTTEVQS